MTNSTLNDIPYEVFFNVILPLITIKEIGSLTMISTTWRDMCNESEVWRKLYLQGLKLKIIDTSVYIGPPSFVYATHSNWRETVKDIAVCRYGATIHWLQSPYIIKCIPGLPSEVKRNILPWSWINPLNDQTGQGNRFHYQSAESGLINLNIYLDYVEKQWKDYNISNGLSEVNLCQRIEYYKLDTLEGKTKCRNLKSFKKAVLKKQLTQCKKDNEKKKRLAEKNAKEYKLQCEKLIRMKENMLSTQKDYEKGTTLCIKLKEATE